VPLTRPTYQRALGALLVLAAAAASAAAPAGAADARVLMVRGAGFGHGVGMSQQGALGYARHGFDYRAILAHYYSATTLGLAAPASTVRALLQANAARVKLSGASRVNGTRLRPAVTYTVTLAGAHAVRIRVDARHTLSAPLLRFSGSAPLTLRGRALGGLQNGAYPGALELRPAAHGGVNAIDAVALEDYVRGVIPNEVPASWPAAALQAQAVASRTFALTAHAGPAGVFDVYADTRSQVYRGVADEQPATNAAAAATAGQIVTYAGHPAITYFFSTSGGATENVENAFPGAAADPWLRGVPDPYDSGPLHSWGPERLSFADAAARLGGLVRGAFAGIEVVRRGFSPRIVDAYVLGSQGATPVTGDELAARLGLYDTWAYFSVQDATGEHPEPDRSAQPQANSGGGGGPPPSPAGTSGGTPAGPTSS
jgi:stage II sporulation protein D